MSNQNKINLFFFQTSTLNRSKKNGEEKNDEAVSHSSEDFLSKVFILIALKKSERDKTKSR